MKTYRELHDELLVLYENKDYGALQKNLAELEAIDIAEFLEDIDEDDHATIFRLLPKDASLEIFVHLETDGQEDLIERLSDLQVGQIVDEIYNDDLVNILEELPANVVKKILANTSPERRVQVNKLLNYPANSAGSIMTTEYLSIDDDLTIAEAFKKLRSADTKLETIYSLFITTPDNRLEGVLTVRDIFAADDEEFVEDVMERSVVAVRTTDDQEEVALMFDRYDLLTLPVVDLEGRLVGIVTVDDALDIMQEEASKDLSIMAAVSPSDKSYLDTSILEHTRSRLPWLILLMFSGIINAGILGSFEESILLVPALVGFIPMLTDTGGNAGAQGSAIVIRSLALQEIGFKDIFKVVWKEIRIGLGLGLAMGVVNFIRLYFFSSVDLRVAMTVSLALVFVPVAAKFLGALLPMLASQIKIDPAVMAGPLIATILDAITIVIYFSLAKLIIFSQLG